jgi:1-hydroxycarotenoid 3,4-desaturase
MGARACSVVVIGAGVGGLACAIDLASSGLAVTVLERAPVTGGKMRTVEVGGLEVDAGPTVLTMRWVFDELFASAGRELHDYARLDRAEVLARHAWPDGGRLDLFADHERSVDAIARLSGRDDAERYRRFCARARGIFETVEGPFMRSQRPTLGSLMRHTGQMGLGALARVDAHRTMWRSLEGAFHDPRLRQLFGRYATYCGSSPFSAPATLNVIAHVESLGVHRIQGGMGALARGLERLARELGVVVRTRAEVAEVVVRAGRAVGVRLGTDEMLEADAVVSNADVSALGSGMFGAAGARAIRPTGVSSRSLSAVTWATVCRVEGFPLVHHNVFFSPDCATEFASLTRDRRVPDSPTAYVCALDRGDESTAQGQGDERLLVVVNAPASGDDPSAWTDEERERCERNFRASLRRCGLELSSRQSVQTTPVEFHRLFPGTGGALYGPMASGPLSALSRPGSRTRIARLYMAGGSVHPGPGVPMAALSGRLAAESVKQDLASTARSRPVATSGSTSTA